MFFLVFKLLLSLDAYLLAQTLVKTLATKVEVVIFAVVVIFLVHPVLVVF